MSEMKLSEQTLPIPRLMKIVPPVWIVILLVLGLCLYRLFPSRELLDRRCYPAAIILFVLGFFSVLWAGSLFHKRGTEILPHSPTNKLLMTDGPYRFTRNPMY